MATDLGLLVYTERKKMFDKLSSKTEDFFGDSIDKSKSSFLTYLLEMQSDISSDINMYNGMLFNERFINTARFRKNLLSAAHPFGYVEKESLPEKIESYVSIKLNDSDFLQSNIGNVWDLRQKDIIFRDGRIDFILPGDVKFFINNSGVFTVLLKDSFEGDNTFRQVVSQMITIGGTRYLTFKVTLYQLTMISTTEMVTNRDNLTYYSFNINASSDVFSTNIHFFDDGNNSIGLKRLKNFLDIESNKNLNVFTLDSIDENNYEVNLDNGSRFRFIPTGTELHIDIYQTLGADGRVKEPIFTVINNSDTNRELVAYSKLSSSGGRSRLNLIDLKKDIIKTIQTPDRKTVVNKTDLANVLSEILDTSVEDSVILLRRNDPVARQTDIFIKATDHKDEVLQTNTLNILTQNDESTFYPSFSRFKLVDDSLQKATIGDNNGTFYYSTLPMRVNTIPYYNLDVFSNNVERSERLVEKYVSTQYTSFTINTDFLDFKYDSVNKQYDFTASLFSNNGLIFEDNAIMSTVNVELSFSLNAFKTFYIKLVNDPEDDPNIFKGVLKTEEIYNSENNLLVGQVYLDNESTEYVYNEPFNVLLNSVTTADIYIYMSNTTHKISSDTNELEVRTFTDKYYKPPNTTTLFSRNTMQSIKLFDVVSSSFYSSIEETGTGKLLISNVPVIGSPDFEDTRNKASIDRLLESINKIHDSVKDIKEEPSNLSVKLFNTYGKTDDYSNTTKTDLSLEVEISIDTKLASNNVVLEVKKEISKLVEERTKFITSNSVLDRNIYLSDIILAVKENVTGIIQIRILKVNGTQDNSNLYYKGSIDYLNLSKETMKHYTPSIPNCRTDYISVRIV